MKHRFTAPIAAAATALVLLGSCSDDDTTTSGEGTTSSEDGPTTLAKGEGVELVGDENLGAQTLDIRAVDDDGNVSGLLRFTDVSGEVEVDLECADTDTDDLTILGGTVSSAGEIAGRMSLIIREGEPRSVAVWFELPLPEGGVAAGSCSELLGSIPSDVLADDAFVDVESGDLEIRG